EADVATAVYPGMIDIVEEPAAGRAVAGGDKAGDVAILVGLECPHPEVPGIAIDAWRPRPDVGPRNVGAEDDVAAVVDRRTEEDTLEGVPGAAARHPRDAREHHRGDLAGALRVPEDA